jgi:Family of unknown function (DUF5302)
MSDTGPEPERTENADVPEEPEAAGAPEDDDEAKRKFRDALERKRTRETSTAAGAGSRDGGKVQGAHGPASSRRSFRRRGGG